MLFNSFSFLFLFLPATLLVFSLAAANGAGRKSLQSLMFFASCIFIGASGLLSLCLLLLSLIMNYLLLRWLAATVGGGGRRAARTR